MGRWLAGWLAVVLLTATGAAEAAAPIRIGLTLGLTGKYQQMAVMQRDGYRLWEKRINADGGLLGRPVQVLIRDDHSDRQRAAALYREMIEQDRVDLILGPYSSSITSAVLPVTEKFGYPLLAAGASADSLWEQGYQRVFGVYTPASKYTMGFLEMLLSRGLERVAVVWADDSFSRSSAAGTRKWAARYRLKTVLAKEFHKPGFEAQALVAEIRAARPQALILCGYDSEAIQLRRALAAAAWYPQAFYASVGPVLPEYRAQLGELAEGTFSSSQWEPYPALDYPGSRAFTEAFRDTYGVSPSYHAASAYAAATILATAVTRAGTLNRDQVTRALSVLDLMTLLGRYGADRTGMQVRHFPVIIQWQHGKKQIVWPEELKTAEAWFGEGS